MTASAKDDKRVARVDFYVDSKLVDRDTAAPYRETWRVRKLGYGPHTVTARAYDSAGQLDADCGVGAARARRGGGESKGRGTNASAGPA